jgi:predicted HicB family RNase H-like nuclease
LHKALAIRAMQADESLNNFCNKILKKIISQPDALRANNSLERDM